MQIISSKNNEDYDAEDDDRTKISKKKDDNRGITVTDNGCSPT